MTMYERMKKGLVYDPMDAEIIGDQHVYQEACFKFNQLSPTQSEEKKAYMKKYFAECGEGCYIELPFRANWGGAHLHFGNKVYANFNLTLVDDDHIYVGNHVMIGPNVTMTTANHPICPELREKEYQFNKEIVIGDNVWIGANVTILPGVHIGNNSVIGAYSLVTKDIPENVVAYGIPCKVVREISDYDHEYYCKGSKIDWENL
ncbi:MAG: sugar O-acetyltransferase [Holdemanella sp.]|nr:sugar O-acetyltransferase [Holdemanella sp.]